MSYSCLCFDAAALITPLSISVAHYFRHCLPTCWFTPPAAAISSLSFLSMFEICLRHDALLLLFSLLLFIFSSPLMPLLSFWFSRFVSVAACFDLRSYTLADAYWCFILPCYDDLLFTLLLLSYSYTFFCRCFDLLIFAMAYDTLPRCWYAIFSPLLIHIAAIYATPLDIILYAASLPRY